VRFLTETQDSQNSEPHEAAQRRSQKKLFASEMKSERDQPDQSVIIEDFSESRLSSDSVRSARGSIMQSNNSGNLLEAGRVLIRNKTEGDLHQYYHEKCPFSIGTKEHHKNEATSV